MGQGSINRNSTLKVLNDKETGEQRKDILEPTGPMSRELLLLNKKCFQLMSQEVLAGNEARLPYHARKNLAETTEKEGVGKHPRSQKLCNKGRNKPS